MTTAHHPSASGTSASPQKIGDLVSAFPPAYLLASYAGAFEVAGLPVLVVSSSAHASAVGWSDCGLFDSFSFGTQASMTRGDTRRMGMQLGMQHPALALLQEADEVP